MGPARSASEVERKCKKWCLPGPALLRLKENALMMTASTSVLRESFNRPRPLQQML